ncbi:hypothetical protein GIB67_031233 [Kingdonia uniflora]|uniref:Uncharacterized protein n=1 Tax=Kingdonia uniflora TaxID=39325 RepID=A0A7J7NKW0_9MAGN|nr:hypothetical protein GIB67_031233 [Kingdonia uniflora]
MALGQIPEDMTTRSNDTESRSNEIWLWAKIPANKSTRSNDTPTHSNDIDNSSKHTRSSWIRVASKKTKADEKKSGHAVEALEGLDTLANLAILEEGETPSTSCQVTTTRHPRHKPGCTCIVCIQPPSGKGPKHSDSCMCNICLTVRRRLSTQMERRVKRKLEKEAEKIRKEQEQEPETPEQEENNPSYITGPNPVPDDDDCNRKNTSSPPKGCIDLNIQPDREEERSPVLPTS